MIFDCNVVVTCTDIVADEDEAFSDNHHACFTLDVVDFPVVNATIVGLLLRPDQRHLYF
jgi:hypothetical protein